MKLMIASDIHGSEYYCKKLLEQYEKENADKLILLGDLLYHGPRNDLPREYNPKAVIAMLNENKKEILCVAGNCEAPVDQMVLEFPVLADYAILYLQERMVFLTHGHVHNEEHLPMLKKGDILIHGHTHVPIMVDRGEYIFMNPGSVSIPKENSVHGYITYEKGIFIHKDFSENVIQSFAI